MKVTIATGMIGLGFTLLVLSTVWVRMFPGTASWTTEKETRLSEVSQRLHVLTFTIGNAEARPSMHGGPDLLKAKDELEALKKENAELTSEFKGIQTRPHTASKIMKWSGISLAVLGVIGWYAINQTK